MTFWETLLGDSTWWWDHPIPKFVVKTALFLIGMAPYVAGVVWVSITIQHSEVAGFEPVFPPLWVLLTATLLVIVWFGVFLTWSLRFGAD